MDLGEWWRNRRWRGLLELIDQLPSASRYYEAVMNDPEQAELLAKLRSERSESGAEEEPWSPGISEYDLHAHLQRDIIQALISVRQAVIASAGGKPGKSPEYPVPVTEVDRVMARLETAWANDLLAKFGYGDEFF